jgi:hypothetical protein
MSLADVVRANLTRSMALYDDLLAALPESALAMKLPGVPSNTIGAQLWCVIGARESYARAVEAGAWAGFACSLTSAGSRDKLAVGTALSNSAGAVVAKLDPLESYEDARTRFIADLLEHEAAHHGQLIRYLYGLRLPIPDSWKARYALD